MLVESSDKWFFIEPVALSVFKSHCCCALFISFPEYNSAALRLEFISLSYLFRLLMSCDLALSPIIQICIYVHAYICMFVYIYGWNCTKLELLLLCICSCAWFSCKWFPNLFGYWGCLFDFLVIFVPLRSCGGCSIRCSLPLYPCGGGSFHFCCIFGYIYVDLSLLLFYCNFGLHIRYAVTCSIWLRLFLWYWSVVSLTHAFMCCGAISMVP